MSGVIGDFLLIRHGRPPFHAGDDDRLADARQSIFGLEGRGSGTEGADTGYDVIGNALLGEDVHLLADGAIDRWIARMQADGHPALALPFFHGRHDGFQRHAGAVEDAAAFFGTGQQLWVDQGAGVNNLVRCFQ